MSDIAAIPAAITQQMVLGYLLGLDLATARTVEQSAPAMARPAGLAVLAATDLASAQAAIGYRRPSSPFSF